MGDQLSFELPNLQGEIIRTSDSRFEKRVLLVTLWGPWCPPCISEIPTFNRLQTRYAEEGLVVVAIAFDRGEAAESWKKELSKFVRKHDIEYLVLDGGSTDSFSRALPMMDEVYGLPVEILIDRSGQVVDCRNGYGYTRNWERKLEGRIKQLLQETP
jgi:thiol-disulfide isomerase/thioredoxin